MLFYNLCLLKFYNVLVCLKACYWNILQSCARPPTESVLHIIGYVFIHETYRGALLWQRWVFVYHANPFTGNTLYIETHIHRCPITIFQHLV